MNPNNSWPNSQPSPEIPSTSTYLDSIATPVPQKTMPPWMLWALIGGVLLLGIIVFFMVSSSGPNTTDRLVALTQRMQSVETLAKTNAIVIKNSRLSALNASMDTILTGAIQKTTSTLASSGVKQTPTTDPKSAIGREFSTLSSKLIDADLNVKFDSVYAREMAYQVSKIMTEMDTIYKDTNQQSLKTTLKTIYGNLQPIAEQLSSFNESAFVPAHQVVTQSRQIKNLVVG